VDATLFQRADMVEAGWKVIQPVLDAWKSNARRPVSQLRRGNLGPAEATIELLARDGRTWRAIGEEQTQLLQTELPETLARATAGPK